MFDYTNNVKKSEFALLVRRKRLEKKLSINDLAKKLNMDAIKIFDIENDRTKLTFKEKNNILKELNKKEI